MKIVVGTAAVQVNVNGETPIIQNLGPGVIYMDTVDTVTTANGVRLAVGNTYEYPGDMRLAGPLFLISDQANTDVRVMVVG